MKKLIILFICLFVTVLTCLGQGKTDPQYIYDQANILNPSEQKKLKNILEEYHHGLGIHLIFYTTESLEEKKVKAYSQQIAQELGFRDMGMNLEGMIFMSGQERQVSIECGSGLEWTVPDVFIREIKQEMVDFFRRDSFYNGIILGFKRIYDYASKASWDVDYYSTQKLKEEFVNGINRIMILECTAVSKRIKDGMVGMDQISNSYFIYVKDPQNKLVKLHFTKYTIPQIEQLIAQGQTKIYARIAKTTPLDVDFLGFVEVQ